MLLRLNLEYYFTDLYILNIFAFMYNPIHISQGIIPTKHDVKQVQRPSSQVEIETPQWS